MLSIGDLVHIKKPIIWTLHDMWAFCGAEHVAFDSRWRDGYKRTNRPHHESGFDLNRWTWERKRRNWVRHFHITTPSSWMASCVRESALMHDWPVNIIPNCLDTERWYPIDKRTARDILGFPRDVPLIMFGANGLGANLSYNKGFDLLLASLAVLRNKIPDLEIIIFGQSQPSSSPNFGFPVRYLGYLHDDYSLRLAYSAVNAVLVPSRSESFCQTASEAHACATPVVSYAIGGLTDIIDHKQTGYLARAFDTNDFAEGIAWVLSKNLCSAARERAVKLFSSNVVCEYYNQLYRSI